MALSREIQSLHKRDKIPSLSYLLPLLPNKQTQGLVEGPYGWLSPS